MSLASVYANLTVTCNYLDFIEVNFASILAYNFGLKLDGCLTLGSLT